MKKSSALKKINEAGALLVFPVKNKNEPDSLWQQFFPKKEMVWEWGDESDNSVADLWHLMKELSSCGEVIYSKWYQGRATFFSVKLFTALLCVTHANAHTSPSMGASGLLDVLETDSPLSTREIKKRTSLQGKFNEGVYNKALKELFQRFLIVGFGEVDDGAFPSLAVGATKLLYEEMWQESKEMSQSAAWESINHFMPEKTLFRKQLEKIHYLLNLV